MNIIIELTVDDISVLAKNKPFEELSPYDFYMDIGLGRGQHLFEKADFIVFRNPFGENIVFKQKYSDRAPSIIDEKYANARI